MIVLINKMYIINETSIGLNNEYDSSYNINNDTNIDSDVCTKFDTALSISMIISLPLFGFAIMVYSIMCLHMYIKMFNNNNSKLTNNNSIECSNCSKELNKQYQQEKLMEDNNIIRNYGETKFEEIELS